MKYDTSVSMGRYWHLRDWWTLIVETFNEYVESNATLFADKQAKLALRYAECQDRAEYADISTEENEIYNYWLLRTTLNAGIMYLYSQFEKKMIELAEIAVSGYIPPRGGIIEGAFRVIDKAYKLEISSLFSTSWKYILCFQQIRHACVHLDGMTNSRCHIEAINTLGELLNTVEHQDGRVEINLTKDNLIFLADKMTYCYGGLIDELAKCETLRNNNDR